MQSTSQKEACNKRQVILSHADLPLSCPPRDKRVWDAHPRVYLPLGQVEKVLCPYCGTEYLLQGFQPAENPIDLIVHQDLDQ